MNRRASVLRVAVSAAVLLALGVARPAAAQTLVSQGRPATASSTENAGTPASAAVDGNAGTRWSSAFSDPQWIYVDLGSTVQVTRVVLTWEAAYGTAYQIQTSNDAVTWTPIFTTTTANGATDDLTGLAGSGRYVRMYGTTRATGYGYSLWELQVYGTTGATPTATARPRATATATTVRATATSTATATATATATTPPTTNVALNKPATAATAENAANAAGMAVDGNLGTRWSSTFSDPQWIRIDLGTTYNVSRVVLRWEAAFGRAYQIQVSNDGTNFTSIFSTTTGDGATDDLTGLSGSGRYLRMYGTQRGTAYGYSLWELEVYGTSGPTPTATTPPRATATFTATATLSATATATTPPLGNIVPLYDSGTALEPVTVVDTGSAIVTRFADRVRDRHARESQFMSYEHYLPFYWEHRTVTIEIVDRVAKGGSDIQFNFTSLWQLNGPNLRCFYRGINTVAEYFHNIGSTQIDTTHYTTTISTNPKMGRGLLAGDRVECEFSPFLVAPPNGRENYYGTAWLYVVGQGGIVPWEGIGAQTVEGVPSPDSFPLPSSTWMGGRTTLNYPYSNEPAHRFKQIATNLAPVNGQPFMLGRRLHHTDFGNGNHSEAGNPAFTAHAGKLGPRFYARSCVECHTNNGRGIVPSGVTITNSVTKVGTATGAADPNLGSSLQPQTTSGSPEGGISISSYSTLNGTYGDGSPYSLRQPNYTFSGPIPSTFSLRAAPPLVGMGLLEAIAEGTIAGLADPNDSNGDGISGRVQTVVDPQTGQTRLGRFGWKGGRARIRHQIASALNIDLGVMTSVFPNPDCGSAQTGCGASGAELTDMELDQMTRYVALLGVAAQRNYGSAQVAQGANLFTSAGCIKCHSGQLSTSAFHPNNELRSQTIRPYTDLLLHDMGAGLADNLGEGVATGAEWRTPPLWSLGLTAGVSGGENYLHDGRARTLAEAILWHGGEGQAAKEVFRTMSAADRAALIAFLQSL